MMKYVVSLVLLIICGFIYFFIQKEQKIEKPAIKKPVLSNTPVKEGASKKKKNVLTAKKRRFIRLVLPSIIKVHEEWQKRYERIAADIKNGTNKSEIDTLKAQYKATSDEDLLAKLKPHPVSIVLAQAALESSWATSRFFKEANNVFGMWSTNPNQKRIAAGEKRGGTQTIWLRKFDTIEDSVRAYYEMIATGGAYDDFRQLRLQYDDPYKITQGLDKYSEIGSDYADLLNQVIKHNHFTQYDR